MGRKGDKGVVSVLRVVPIDFAPSPRRRRYSRPDPAQPPSPSDPASSPALRAVPPLQDLSWSSDLLSTEMRGVGGPLLTVSDLLSDLAVEGGDDQLDGGGDASVPSSPLAAQDVGEANPSELQRLFAEDYDNLMKSLRENDPSWPSLMLKLCRALKTSDKLLSCANVKAEQLLEKVDKLQHVLERGDRAVGSIIEVLQSMQLTEDHQTSKSNPPSK